MNRPDGTLEVVPYDASWPGRFDAERATLLGAVPELFVSLEHVGSTAVPGLPAKPTIDMLAVVDDVHAVLGPREWLTAQPDAARRYAALKLDLVARFAGQRQAYVDAKQREVDVLMVEARRWAASRRRTAPGR